MPGLGTPAPQAGRPPMPPQETASTAAPGEAPNVTPEEQDLYNRFVAMCMMGLFDEGFAPKFAEMLKGSADPVDTLAEGVASLAVRVVALAAEEGTPIPGDIVLHGGREVVEQAAEIAEKAGVEMDEAQLEQAYYRALDKGRAMAQREGLFDEEGAARDAETLRAMSQDGRLDQVMAQLAAMQGAAPQTGEAA